MKAYREANKEKARAYDKAWRIANKEKVSEHNKKYSSKNKEKRAEYQRGYYQDNIQEIKDKSNSTYASNKEAIRAKQKAYYETNKLPYTIVYSIPDYNGKGDDYCGVTSYPEHRMSGHKTKGRLNTDKWYTLDKVDKREDAMIIEAKYHSQGYHGANNGL